MQHIKTNADFEITQYIAPPLKGCIQYVSPWLSACPSSWTSADRSQPLPTRAQDSRRPKLPSKHWKVWYWMLFDDIKDIGWYCMVLDGTGKLENENWENNHWSVWIVWQFCKFEALKFRTFENINSEEWETLKIKKTGHEKRLREMGGCRVGRLFVRGVGRGLYLAPH